MARTGISRWSIFNNNYITPEGSYDLLINGSNHYINFGSITGFTGYGFRDNGGTMEFKDSGGAWTSFAGSTAGVSSVNGLTGAITLAAGTNITLVPVGNTITINSTGGGGGGSPGGSDTQLQYNNAGSFGGISGATSNGTVVTLTAPVIATSLTANYATVSTVPYFDASKNLISSAVTPTELGYLSGVTSAIQTQLNSKGAGTVTSVSGTSNRITSTGGATPVIDISASYVGQSSITTLGTIATGVWQGTAIGDTYISSAATWNAKQSAITFGTGVQTALGVNIGSAGAPVLFNGAGGTPSSLTGTNISGTAASLTAGASTILANTRTIWGQNFNGSANVTGTLALGTADLTLTGSVGATGARATKLWATDIESTNMPTVGGTVILSSLTAPSFTTVELGAGGATDTTLSRSAAGQLAVEGVDVLTTSNTKTVTNKRRTRRLTTTNAPGATPTTNSDNVDIMNFTGLATAITSMTTNLSGTPVDGDLLEFRFTDDGTARAITWGATFAATTVALPTTTVISTMLRVGFEYSGSTWKCIAVA